MHFRELYDDRPADREGSDTDDAREDDTSHLSESSSGLSDSAHGSEILFTILPCPPVGHAKWPANHISKKKNIHPDAPRAPCASGGRGA